MNEVSGVFVWLCSLGNGSHLYNFNYLFSMRKVEFWIRKFVGRII